MAHDPATGEFTCRNCKRWYHPSEGCECGYTAEDAERDAALMEDYLDGLAADRRAEDRRQ